MSEIRERSFEWRASSTAEGDGLTLEGYAAVFDQWTEIEDWDGRYLESLARGAFRKTLRERKDRVLLQYDHGHHPVLGSIPLGSIEQLKEDAHGLFVRARLHDNWMTQPVRDGISSGAIQDMSFRFRVIGEQVEKATKANQLDRRTITEVALFELGPVAFGAYAGTDVGLRAWADAAPVELRAALLDGRADTMTVDSTPTPAGSTTGDETGAADRDEPAMQVTRQERRRWAAVLRGVNHEQAGAPAERAA